MIVEYCSYKGLTQFNQRMIDKFESVEYCSYKGLTPYTKNIRLFHVQLH